MCFNDAFKKFEKYGLYAEGPFCPVSFLIDKERVCDYCGSTLTFPKIALYPSDGIHDWRSRSDGWNIKYSMEYPGDYDNDSVFSEFFENIGYRHPLVFLELHWKSLSKDDFECTNELCEQVKNYWYQGVVLPMYSDHKKIGINLNRKKIKDAHELKNNEIFLIALKSMLEFESKYIEKYNKLVLKGEVFAKDFKRRDGDYMLWQTKSGGITDNEF